MVEGSARRWEEKVKPSPEHSSLPYVKGGNGIQAEAITSGDATSRDVDHSDHAGIAKPMVRWEAARRQKLNVEHLRCTPTIARSILLPQGGGWVLAGCAIRNKQGHPAMHARPRGVQTQRTTYFPRISAEFQSKRIRVDNILAM
jgi:hypothetical protein